jgi:hypothetical protein
MRTNRTNLISKRTIIAGALVLIPWSSVLTLHAADQWSPSVIPEIMGEQPLRQHAVPMIEMPPAQAVWITEIPPSLEPADELSNLSQTATPFQEYGIGTPKLRSGRHGLEVLSSESSQ